jgi:hypothetical protein
MPPSALSRGPITTALVTHLETAGFPVGDNSAPTIPYGWQGEPDSANTTFIPWMSLTPGTATPQNPPGTFADTGTEWRLSYTVFYAGVTRKQQEALADRMRSTLVSITRQGVVTDTGTWRIQKVSCPGVGSSNRIGSAYPDYFTQSDTFEVWITKE